MTAPVRMIIDTDGGVDDAVALWWALTSPAVELLGITTVHGNVGVETATANVLRVLDAAGRPEVPVAVGLDRPLGPVPDLRPADFIHGTDGLGETFRPAASFGPGALDALELLDTLAAPDVTVVALGPLSNLGALLAEDPGWAGEIGRLAVMGGTVDGPGNAMPYGEANITHDPDAAALVATAGWAVPPLLVGLDVTHRATLSEAEFVLLAEHRTPAASFLDEPLAFYRRFAGTLTPSGECTCHDLVATIAAVETALVTGPVLPMAVVAQPGPAWGSTIVDRRVPFFERAGDGATQSRPEGFGLWQIGTDVDVASFRTHVRRLFGD